MAKRKRALFLTSLLLSLFTDEEDLIADMAEDNKQGGGQRIVASTKKVHRGIATNRGPQIDKYDRMVRIGASKQLESLGFPNYFIA